MIRHSSFAIRHCPAHRRPDRPRTRADGLGTLSRLRSIGALVWLFLGCGAASLPAAQARLPKLCLEDVPGIVYEDEPITVCVRVEAGSGVQGPLSLTVSLCDAAGRALASDSAEGTPKADAPWRHSSSLAPAGSPATLEVALGPAGGGAPLAALSLGILSGRASLPPLAVRGLGLTEASGRRAILRIEHRIRVVEERWPLVRWVRRQFSGDRWTFRHVLVLGDDLGPPQDGYLPQVASALGVATTAIVAVPSEASEVGPPVLRAVAALTAAKAPSAPELAVLCLGARDPDFGTDLLQFGRALELALQQLEARGCRQFVVVSPVGPSHLRRRLAPYVQAAERVAFTYQARFLDLTSRMADDHWSGEPRDDRLVLRLPNAAGHRTLADAIATYLSSLKR